MLRWIPMTLVMGIIFFLSHQAGGPGFYELFPGQDKVEHFSIYFVLGLCVLYGVGPERYRRKPLIVGLVAVGVCLLYGVSDELHQSFIPDRFPDVWDVVADVCGGVAAALLGYQWLSRKAKK